MSSVSATHPDINDRPAGQYVPQAVGCLLGWVLFPQLCMKMRTCTYIRPIHTPHAARE